MPNVVHGGLLRGIRGDARLAITGVDAAHHGVIAAAVPCYRLWVGPTCSVRPMTLPEREVALFLSCGEEGAAMSYWGCRSQPWPSFMARGEVDEKRNSHGYSGACCFSWWHVCSSELILRCYFVCRRRQGAKLQN